MAFEFLNDDDDSLPGSTPGESQPYEEGTVNSASKKLSSLEMQDTPEQKNKREYAKHKASVEDAYGHAQKVLTRNTNGQYVTGEQDNTWSGIDHDSRQDVDLLKQRVLNREHPLKLADDMREIAGRPSVPPQFQKLLHQGADKFQDAYQSQAALSGMQAPEAPVGTDQEENRYGSAQADAQGLDEAINQKREQLSTAGHLRAPKIEQELRDLYNQKRQAALVQNAGGSMGDPNLNMHAVLTAAGWERRDYIQANAEMWRGLRAHGISPDAPVTKSTFPVIIPKIVEEAFSPEIAQKWYQEIIGDQPPPDQKPDKSGGKDGGTGKSQVVSDNLEKDPRFKDISDRLATSQQQHDALWKELANSGTFNNVGDIIGFVLSSIVLGPRAACALFTNMDRNGNLRQELDLVNHETSQLFHEQNSYIQLARSAREQAIQEEYHKDSRQDRDERLQETERHNKVSESYMKMRMAGTKSAWTPEEQATARALQQGVRMKEGDLQAQEAVVKRLEKIVNNPMDPQFKQSRSKIAVERSKLEQLERDHANIMIKVRKWYMEHGGNDIEPKHAEKAQEPVSQEDQ